MLFSHIHTYINIYCLQTNLSLVQLLTYIPYNLNSKRILVSWIIFRTNGYTHTHYYGPLTSCAQALSQEQRGKRREGVKDAREFSPITSPVARQSTDWIYSW